MSLAHTALDAALVTPREAMAPEVRERLGALLGTPSHAWAWTALLDQPFGLHRRDDGRAGAYAGAVGHEVGKR